MGKVDVDALSHVLEHLQTAHHEVQAAVPVLSNCGQCRYWLGKWRKYGSGYVICPRSQQRFLIQNWRRKIEWDHRRP